MKMNHLKNIREILSIPTGSRNVATSGYSSFTDSQVFFGSQFWPENSQGTSQDVSLSSRNSQQSSQEGSDPKTSSSYHTKPLLFGELKDKTRPFGILDKFEEDKRKAKEKNENDVFAKECHHIKETLKDIQQLVAGTEKNTATCQTVLEKIDNYASTLKNNLTSLQSDMSQHFETLLNKVNAQKELITELEERVRRGEDSKAEHGSNLQSLKNSLESLREEQDKGRNMLEEALKLLSTLVSKHLAKLSPERVIDSASQTSPGLEHNLNILQDKKLEGTQPQYASNLQHASVEVPSHNSLRGKRKFSPKCYRRRKKRPLVLPQKKRCTSDENNPSFIIDELNAITGQDSSDPDCLTKLNRDVRSSEAAGCLITPLSCWSQDSNSSTCLAGIKPILEKLSAESTAETPVKHQNFWQLFDMDCDSDVAF